MIDEYVVGEVKRISPEAPIPVLENSSTHREAGGSANVAMNLRGLGCQCAVFGVVGDDEPGQWLKEYLSSNGIDIRGIIVDKARPTTRKIRYGTTRQVILRVDYEDRAVTTANFETWKHFLDSHDVQMVLVSDYNKGILRSIEVENSLWNSLRQLTASGTLTVADTKRKGLALGIFEDFTLVKPNLSELELAVDIKVDNEAALDRAAAAYLAATRAQGVLVTLGDEGMYYRSSQGMHLRVPTVSADVYDVTGAGDTVLAVLALALHNRLTMDAAMRLANIAASVVISRRGTTHISSAELERRVEDVRLAEPSYFVQASGH